MARGCGTGKGKGNKDLTGLKSNLKAWDTNQESLKIQNDEINHLFREIFVQPKNQEETDHIKFRCQLFINGLQNLDGVAKVT